jgi:hypothetical protein
MTSETQWCRARFIAPGFYKARRWIPAFAGMTSETLDSTFHWNNEHGVRWRMLGYSGTPLATKLGIKADSVVLPVNAPDDYAELIGETGARFATRLTKFVSLVHLFTTKKSALANSLKTYRDKLMPDAAVWVSWPKKSSKVSTDVTEDVVREVALPLGWVDVKVCAVTDIWSGLKLVVRKSLR